MKFLFFTTALLCASCSKAPTTQTAGRFVVVPTRLPVPGLVGPDYQGAIKLDTVTGETWRYDVAPNSTKDGKITGWYEGWSKINSDLDEIIRRQAEHRSKAASTFDPNAPVQLVPQ